MSFSTVQQLYKDVATVSAANPHANLTANTASLYNANLAAAKLLFPKDTFLELLPEATTDTAYYDLLIMTGQLKEAMAEAASENKPPRKAGFA